MSPETLSQQSVPVGTWTVDPVHSSIGFAITHSGIATFRGGFDSFEATLGGGEQPRLEGNVAVASVDIGEEQLKGHLLSPDFFDAERYPRLTFVSSELAIAADGSARLAGELEIRGQTHRVEASGRFGQVGAYIDGNPRLGLSVQASIDRRQFGIEWNAELPGGGQALEYEVTISADLQFVAAEG